MIRKTCHLIEHGISINPDSIEVCCLARDDGKKGHPLIVKDYNPNQFDWNKVFEIKKEQIEAVGIGDFPPCDGCYALEEKEVCNEDISISYINFNQWTICNSRCIYCDRECYQPIEISVVPMIRDLVQSGHFKSDGEITFQGGEPTVLKEFDTLVNIFSEQNAKIRVHSSGIKYSQALKDAINKGLGTVVISPDSGTPQVYESIKRVKCFDKVFKNAKSYAEGLDESLQNRVKLKYIIVPGKNDTIEEVDEFFRQANIAGVKNIIIDIEFTYYFKNKDLDLKNIEIIVDYMINEANKNGFGYEFYDCAKYFAQSRKGKTSKTLFANKFILKQFYNHYKNKNLNINLKYKS